MPEATFRFYEELNDFLPPALRKQRFCHRFARAATVKNAIEALGVPHTEVELILVNGASVDFGYLMRPGDDVSVYPKFEALDVTPLLRVRTQTLRDIRFVADSHLGGLARMLRMVGFDTLYRNDLADHEIRALAAAEHRIVLTRDRELLKHRLITHGCYVHALRAREQFVEVVERLDLARSLKPFSRCLDCNQCLQGVEKHEIERRLPDKVRAHYSRFSLCRACDKVYWEGSHWRAMQEQVARLLAPIS